MSETLRNRQVLFARLLPRLIDHAFTLGYEVTLGECHRMPVQCEVNALGLDGRRALVQVLTPAFMPLASAVRKQAGGGIRNSLHNDRLAIDLNLFRDGIYLPTTEAHRPLGEWWERQNDLCHWGGRFGDGNHYSVEWMGRK